MTLFWTIVAVAVVGFVVYFLASRGKGKPKVPKDTSASSPSPPPPPETPIV